MKIASFNAGPLNLGEPVISIRIAALNDLDDQPEPFGHIAFRHNRQIPRPAPQAHLRFFFHWPPSSL
ncbi:TPA: hypothetical protein QDB29_001495 [Burkholderia vietnamiensis]|nr:hypothetical protein [Burkholderia vietnamiensis]